MSFICLRIGAVNASDQPNQDRQFSVYCSQENIVSMVEACIKAPDRIKFDIFYVVSDNKWSYRIWNMHERCWGINQRGKQKIIDNRISERSADWVVSILKNI